MSCGCKGDNNYEIPGTKDVHEAKLGLDINKVVKWVAFIMVTILSPIIAPPILVFALYKGIIKNERLDAILMFKAITLAAHTIITKEERDEDEFDMMDELEVVDIEEAV